MKKRRMNLAQKNVGFFGVLRIVFVLFSFAIIGVFWGSHAEIETPVLDGDIVESLLDISTLSEDFMTDYFSEVPIVNAEYDAEHTLIVTAYGALENNFGAAKVVSAPNHQFFLYYDSEEEKERAFVELDNDDAVLFVEPDAVLEISAYNSWGIEDIGLDRAVSAINLDSANDVTVAIVDTGCDLDVFNESFNGRIEETYNLYDYYMHDDNGHGTHIAGTIAEGTSENVKILPVKVSNSRSLRTVNVITAVNYINYYHKADVINMSFGSNDNSKSEFVAIQAAADNNIIMVAAAGNESSSADRSYPAAWDNTISVSAVDSNHEFASFSNHGSTVTFAAPGVDIDSINGKKSGTSMATPHVVSAVALLKSINKNLTLEQVVTILETAAVDLGTEGRDEYYGYGLIDVSSFATLASMAKKTSIANFEVTDVSKIRARFGNITNLMDIPVRVTDSASNTYEATLADLDGLEISGYDAFAAGDQSIRLTWNGVSKIVVVNNGIGGGNMNGYYTANLNDQEIAIIDASHVPKKVYIPETINGRTVVAIGDDIEFFYGQNVETESVILPSTVREIRPKAFYQLTTLKSVTGGAEYVSVGAQAFYGDYELSEFEPKISALGEAAFYNTSIERAVLSNTITTIPTSAFQGCERLTTLNLPSSLVELGDYALAETSLTSLSFPASFTVLGVDALKDITNLENITVAAGNPVYDSRNNSSALIETATNTIILGSGNTVIPDTVTAIASYAFYGNQKIQTIYTNNVVDIGYLAFSGCVSLHEFHIENIVLTEGEMLDGRFSTDSMGKYGSIPDLIIFDDVSTTTSITIYNILSKQHVAAYIITSRTSIEVSAEQTYEAFEEVEDLTLVAHFYGMANYPYVLEETIKNYTIEYQHGDSFRAGDTFFTVRGTTQFGDSFERTLSVTVAKAMPVYVIPDDIVATYEQSIGSVALPAGFQWTQQNTIVDAPNYFYARYVPSDTVNYQIVENLGIFVQVTTKNNSIGYEGFYDGSSHTITPNFEPSATAIVKYSIDGVNYNLDAPPEFTDVGQYIVYYLVKNPDFVDLKGSNEVCIYGVEGFENDVIVKGDIVIADWGKNFTSIKNSVNIFAESSLIEHRDKDNRLVNSTAVKTGDKMRVVIGNYEWEYVLVIRGDVNGDGEIGIIDYIRIKKDIMDIEKLAGIYYEAADVNNNGEIDIIDYIRIKKIIMEAGS